MKKSIAVFTAVILILSMMLGLVSCKGSGNDNEDVELKEIELDSWSPVVRNGINAMMSEYGKTSENYDDTTYVVFDFDNTCSIFDVEEQLAVYQLQHMAFAEDMTEEKLADVQ